MTPPMADLEKQALALRDSAADLTHRFPSMKTFQEAAEWKRDAVALIRWFERYGGDLAGLRVDARNSRALSFRPA